MQMLEALPVGVDLSCAAGLSCLALLSDTRWGIASSCHRPASERLRVDICARLDADLKGTGLESSRPQIDDALAHTRR